MDCSVVADISEDGSNDEGVIRELTLLSKPRQGSASFYGEMVTSIAIKNEIFLIQVFHERVINELSKLWR